MSRTARSRIGRRAGVTVVVALAVATAASAAERPFDLSRPGPAASARFAPSLPSSAPAPPVRGSAVVPVTASFGSPVRAPAAVRSPWRDHFLPRLNGRFDGLDSRDPLTVLGLAADATNAHRDLADVAARGAHRAVERALGDWALSATDLEARLDAWVDRRIAPARSGGETAPARRRPDVSVGVAHLAPKVELSWSVGSRAAVRVLVRGRGETGVELLRRGPASARVFAGYDPDRDRVRVQFRRSF